MNFMNFLGRGVGMNKTNFRQYVMVISFVKRFPLLLKKVNVYFIIKLMPN